MISIIDYGMGNLRSVQKGFARAGVEAEITRDAARIEAARGVVLPGVGAFGACMDNLRRFGLVDPVRRVIDRGTPFLGICLGLQLLFEKSEEFGPVDGLGVFRGRCVRFANGGDLRVPHMGWNRLAMQRRVPHLDGIDEGAFVYFVHSYYVVPESDDLCVTTTPYGGAFVSSIARDNVFACQFHPEKSQRIGLRILENFGAIVRRDGRVPLAVTMLVIPAIDLKGGKCVRLLRGDMQAETVYGDDPVAMGRRWVDAGARYLHVVDLDGAVSGAPVNTEAIASLCAKLEVPIEVGGGVRTLERAGTLLAAGADRVIFGTAALEQPEVVAEACRRFARRIAVGIDARGGKVAVKGWTETSTVSAVDLARRLEGLGAAWIIYTDIERDGTLQGVNVEATRALAEAIDIPVIASGGVASLADIEALLPCEEAGVEGVIIGRALYAGAIRLEDAIAAAANSAARSPKPGA